MVFVPEVHCVHTFMSQDLLPSLESKQEARMRVSSLVKVERRKPNLKLLLLVTKASLAIKCRNVQRRIAAGRLRVRVVFISMNRRINLFLWNKMSHSERKVQKIRQSGRDTI